MVEEKLVRERFVGLTQYQLASESLERETHLCFTLGKVLDALEAQKTHFENQGAKIISQRVKRERTTEFYTLGG